MRWVGGHLFHPVEGVIEGAVELDHHGLVQRVETRALTSELQQRALVVPAPTNAHTHIGDRALRGKVKPTSVEEVFAPPRGAKHALLRTTPRAELVGGMRKALAEARLAGVQRVLDFREGGPDGARMAREAAARSAVRLDLFGRPTEPARWEEEARELASLVDGIGISGLADQPRPLSEAQADWCAAHGKRLALHWAEARHEDVVAALALGPDLLVHATCATREDVARISQAQVPVVVCARSNALFGRKPPIVQMLDAGVRVGVGTDNAMFQDVDVWSEARFLVEDLRIEPVDVVRMACQFHLRGEAPPEVAPGARVSLLPAPRDGHVQVVAP